MNNICALKFILEIESNKSLHFLDLDIKRDTNLNILHKIQIILFLLIISTHSQLKT